MKHKRVPRTSWLLFLAITSILLVFTRALPAEEAVEIGDQLVGERSSESKKLAAGTDLDFVSRYLWRGIYFSEGMVWEPSVWVNKWGFTASVWGNYVLNKEADQWKFNEFDFGFSYENSIGKLSIKPGFIYYYYPYNKDNSTAELSVTLSYPIIGPLSLYTIQNFDIDENKGAYYAEFGASLEQKLNDYLTVQGYSSVAWADSKFNDTYYGVSKTAGNNMSFGVNINARPLPYLYIRPHMTYTVVLDKDLRDAYDDPNLYVVGMAAGLSF